ncbi:MAG: DnaD domain protein [Clostridium sp.]|nr:DnaD domain protein [Clostridium sp.]MCM1398660.1 DnaD domain protein [Clostridium sp.]MCM1459945.1 DnaD domain protein [Bacteroides sp.]
MKTITISTENSETYSSISNFFIDYYMTDANGEFVKVYLYLVRLLSNNSSITVAEIADHFNLTENDICRAIKYWIGQNVLKLNYDGKGNLNGIVLLPLHPAQNESKLSSDAVSILRTTMADAAMNPATEAGPVTNISDTVSVTAPVKHKLSKDAIDAKQNDDDWADIVYQVETLFGKQISARDTESLMYIYDDLKFNVDLFEYLIEYCTTMNKKNCRYMEAVAIAWYQDGIKTRQQAKEQSVITNGITKIVFKALGIRRAYPTNIEVAYINTWSKDFGFSSQLIEHACNRAIEARPSSANFAYINGILENWHKNGVKTIDDVNRLDVAFVARNNRKHQTSSSAVSFNNFKQTRLDNELTEMEDLFLKEVNQ